jgi:hypothetical protein
MGNLVRGPRRFLINRLDQTIFGGYIANIADDLEMTGPIFVHKPTGTRIPADNANVNVVAGYGQPENLETIVLDLFAPYPCQVCNYVAELNVSVMGRKQGTLINHREYARVYQGHIPSLEIATDQELSHTDKVNLLKQIVVGVNHDKKRAVNAGLIWVLTDLQADDTCSFQLTLQNGVVKIYTTTNANNLADLINADDDVNNHVRAYSTGIEPNADTVDIKVIVESISPASFEIESLEEDNGEVNAVYLKLEQVMENVAINVDGGTSQTKWQRVNYTRFELDSSGLAADADDGNITVTIGEEDYAIAAGTNLIAEKPGAIAEALSIMNETAGVPASNHTAALVDTSGADDVVIVLSLGTPITAIVNTAVTDLWVITQSDFNHQWPTLSASDMAQLFPNSYGNEHQYSELPDPSSRYFMIDIKWMRSNYDNVVTDGLIFATNHVTFYIREDLLPLVADGTTGTLMWEEGVNMMQDDLANITQDIDFIGLFNLLFGGAVAGEDPITTAMLAG